MAPSKPFAELTMVSAALLTTPFSSAVTTDAVVVGCVTGLSFVADELPDEFLRIGGEGWLDDGLGGTTGEGVEGFED